MKFCLVFFYSLLFVVLFIPPPAHSQQTTTTQITYHNTVYPLFPQILDERPDVPSPYTAEDGMEVVVALTKDGKFTIVPVTIKNEEPWGYETGEVRKGRQLAVDAEDFPTLAASGLHAEIELAQTRAITGKSISEITHIARPGKYSRAGFMGQEEDIISVLTGDNRLVKKLQLTHPQAVRPLFHVWNLVLAGIEVGQGTDDAMNIESMLYNGQEIHLTFSGRGWQESIFYDEIKGAYHLEMWRELDAEETALLNSAYAQVSAEEREDLLNRLSHCHTGDMVPYYIMWYGFYEGHTDFRPDPIAIASIFGLRSIDEIEKAFPGEIYMILRTLFTRSTILQEGGK